ncbi:hypothetical protein EJ104_08935 [Deinococcus radiophilus]|uniref:MobA-like NTP transferase domain-containing protein n=2 Tax=Deinococcus radiophilus TaxID=32062 RepID=A0A3S0I2V2_9DEIO|nr:hypothetical protein EJ104_08935 [Deinococcus radiophilus]
MGQAASPFQAVPKPLVLLAGKPLIRWAAEALTDTADPFRLTVIPAGEAGRQIQAALEGLGFAYAINPTPELGLLSSFQAAVRALPEGLDGAVFSLADMPLISTATHRALRAAWKPGVQAVQCRFGEVSAPPLVVGAELFAPLLALDAADHGPRKLLQGAVTITCPPGELLDVDTPQALVQAETWLTLQR